MDIASGEVVATPVDVMNLPGYPWRTQFNFNPGEQKQKNVYLVYNEESKKWDEKPAVSKTVPDQSMSMDEILRRFKEGRSLTEHPGFYAGYELEEELPDLRKMDLAEIQQLKEKNDQVLRDIHEEMVTKEKQKRQLLEANAKEAWFQQELKKRQQQIDAKAARSEEPGKPV